MRHGEPVLPNAVINGDCLKVMDGIESESIDLILADLPYGVSRQPWDTVIPPEKLWRHYKRTIKPHGAILLFGQDKFTATMMLSNPAMHRYNLIWDKVMTSGFLNARRMPLREHEDIMVFYKQPPPYHPQMTEGAPNHSVGSAAGKRSSDVHANRSYGEHVVLAANTDGKKYPTTIWRYPKIHSSKCIHSTEKPVGLLRALIRTYTDPGALVLDNCCGAGSTLIAAKLEGRRYIGIDNGVCDSPKSGFYGLPWAEVSMRRLAQYED